MFWICCQVPQFYKNWQRGSAEALSVLFLLEWLGGDTLNLAGCILTNQLPTQTYTAMLFVSMDVVMVTQYVYLTYWAPKRKKDAPVSEDSALLDSAHSDLTAPATDFSPLAGRGNGTPERPRRIEGRAAPPALPAIPGGVEGGSAGSGASATGMPISASGSNGSRGTRSSGSGSGHASESGGRSLEYEAPVGAARSATHSSNRSGGSSTGGGGGVSAGLTASIAALGLVSILAVGVVAPLPTLTRPGTGPIPSVVDSVYPGAWAHAGPLLDTPMAAVSALGDAVGWSSLYTAPAHSAAVHAGIISSRALQGVNASALAAVPVGPATVGGRRLDLAPCKSNKTMAPAAKTTGIVLGYISSLLYLNSRLPQIIKNFRRKSVAGLSWLMFFCAFMGNLTTVTAIFMRATTKADYESEAPFLPGNAGTLVFDLTIVIQYALYTRRAQARRKRRAAWKAALGEDAPASDEEGFSSEEDSDGGEGGERRPPRQGQPGHGGAAVRSRDEENLSLLLQNTPRLPSNAPRGVHDIVEDVDAQYLHAPLPTPPMPPRGGDSRSIREAARDWLAAVTQRRGSQ